MQAYVEMQDGFRLPDRTAGEELAPNPNDLCRGRSLVFKSRTAFCRRLIGNYSAGAALGLIVTDMDGDGANDVFVANVHAQITC